MENTHTLALRFFHKKYFEMKMAELIVALMNTRDWLTNVKNKIKRVKAELKIAEAHVKADDAVKS